jgi:anti-sigma28 factor (negative regulator of flagellin synthesis)
MEENKKSSQLVNDMPLPGATRKARLKAIKQAIEAGTYHVDNCDLADSLLSDLLWEQWERIRFFKP